jgi:oxaloacetate decarboxylase gamma subunit
LLQGFELLLLGMGIVFGFLTLLVFALRGMSGLADRLAPMAEQHVDLAGPTGAPDDQRVAAVISAAIARYRRTHR